VPHTRFLTVPPDAEVFTLGISLAEGCSEVSSLASLLGRGAE
jgi:hypothetical protein